MFEFAKELYFYERALGDKRVRDESLIRLLQSPAIMGGSLKESKTRFLSSNPNELCDRLKLLLQEKRAGNNCNVIDEELFAIADK